MARRVLVDFDFLGDRLGFVADGEPCTAELEDGTVRNFVNGVDVGDLPAWVVPIFRGVGAADDSMDVTLYAGLEAVHAARKAIPLQLVKATVFWWQDGSVLRQTDEIFHGVVRSPRWKYDEAGAPIELSFSLQSDQRARDLPFPPAGIADEGRFGSAPDNAGASAVPVVYGTVSGMPLNAVYVSGASPVRLVVAGHTIVSTQISVCRDGAALLLADVEYARDGRGDLYAYVEVPFATYDAGDALYAADVVGFAAPDGTAVDRLGDVMEHMIRTFGRDNWFALDRRRIEFAKPTLNRFRVGFYVNDRSDTTMMQFLESRLAGEFPVETSFSGGRFGWDATMLPPANVEVHDRIVYGQNTNGRLASGETDIEDVVAEVNLEFGYDGYNTGITTGASFDKDNSGDLRRAHSRWGATAVVTINADDCQDTDTAFNIGTDQVRKLSRVREYADYGGLPDRFFFLPRPALVAVTDPGMGWSEELCVLVGAEPDFDGTCNVTVVQLEGL